jgi:hypothetical protein
MTSNVSESSASVYSSGAEVFGRFRNEALLCCDVGISVVFIGLGIAVG